MRGSKGYVILGFRVPTTSVGARGRGKGYVILGFRVPPPLLEQGVCYTRF